MGAVLDSSATKYLDEETGLYYYGYRYYSPMLGRWTSRDPSGEESGGEGLYVANVNDLLNQLDYLGLFDVYTHEHGWGHVGISDDQGNNYDYGRYRMTYWPRGIAGPNILVLSTTWPPQNQTGFPFTVFHFDVCPKIDARIRAILAQKFASGATTLPPSVISRYWFRRPRPLTSSDRYLGTDWSFSDNCMTFTFIAISDAAYQTLHDANATQREIDEANVLNQIVYNGMWQPYPSRVTTLLRYYSTQYDWIKQRTNGGKNSGGASKDKKCCGSSS